jgi:hypothetical protein
LRPTRATTITTTIGITMNTPGMIVANVTTIAVNRF